MGTKELRKRDKWQDESGKKAQEAEDTFYNVFSHKFKNSDLQIHRRPSDFKDVYSKVKLDADTLKEIYDPKETWKHGLIPDYSIHNSKTNKTLYVEVKRQDGWVEGKPRKAGRGNAHERSCKFFTPGLLKILREAGNIDNYTLPFWIVFQGDIARDPKRVREITTWYDSFDKHFFLWYDTSNTSSIINHFDNHLCHLLE